MRGDKGTPIFDYCECESTKPNWCSCYEWKRGDYKEYITTREWEYCVFCGEKLNRSVPTGGEAG